MLNFALTVQSWGTLPSHGRLPAKHTWAGDPWTSGMPTGRGSVEKKQLPFKALGFSARLKHKLQDVRQHITRNSGGRTQCWEISDRQTVASALLVFLDVLEGPEGDMHLCRYWSQSSSLSTYLTLSLRAKETCPHDAGWMKSLLGDCQRVLCRSLMCSFSECASFAQTSEYSLVVTSKAVSFQRSCYRWQ